MGRRARYISLDFGEVLGAGFSQAFRLLLPLGLICVFITLPVLILQLTQGPPPPPPEPDPNDPLAAFRAVDWSGMWLNICVVSVLTALATAAGAYLVVQHLRGRAASVGDALSRASGLIIPLLGLIILYTLSLFLGLILCIVPGIILACMWYVAVPAMVMEGTGVTDSLKRSVSLTSGSRWQVFGILVVGVFIGTVLGALIGVMSVFLPFAAASVLGHILSMGIVQPIGIGLAGSTYFHLRKLREGDRKEPRPESDFPEPPEQDFPDPGEDQE